MVLPPLFITGIGTGVGKTVTSAVLVKKLQANYWKPVQSGLADEPGDRLTVQGLVGESTSQFFSESYALQAPLSPHAAARLEGVVIDPEKIILPDSSRPLVIEGAGGLLVPITETFLIADLIQKVGARVIVVVRHYLGSINHTLLTLEYLSSRQIPTLGIVINGPENSDSERAIKKHPLGEILFRIPEFSLLNTEVVSQAAHAIEFSYE